MNNKVQKADNAIDLNSAKPSLLTQLPGIAKDLAYRIVNYRNRHGQFTAWEELLEVKGFPSGRLDEIKARAVLEFIGERERPAPPRHLKAHLDETKKKPQATSHSTRSTRRSDRMKEGRGPRHG